jgi:DNA-binding MarR family transcriptional regulator
MTDATSDVAGRLAILTGRINRRIRAASGGLSYGSLSALATVQKFGPIRLADLAAQEFISAPSTTRLIAELERRGLVSRTVDPDDGRAFLIESTPAGDLEVVRARQARADLVADMLGDLSPADWAAVNAALDIIQRSVEREEVPPPVRR